jgi:hypothetical protein
MCAATTTLAETSVFDCRDPSGDPRQCDVTCGATDVCYVKCPQSGCRVSCTHAAAQCIVGCADGKTAIPGPGNTYTCP